MVLRRFYGCRTCGGPHYSDECDHNRGRYFGYEDQQNRWSRHEEEDVSLKDMMKNFIDVQNARNDEWETSIKELNDKVEQDFINDQASLQDLERKFERMSERFANQPTGQMQISTHPNPRPNNQNNNGGQSSQGPRYQTPHHRDEQVNAIFTRSGFRYGDEEERNENEKKSELGTSAPQSSPMRRTGGSDGFVLSDHSLGAMQSSPMRRNEPVESENDREDELGVEDQVGDVREMFSLNKDLLEAGELDEIRVEKSLEIELEEFLGPEMGDVDSTINGDITLEEFERMFDLSTEPVVTKNETKDEGEECLVLETKVEKASMEAIDGEPCAKLEVKKDSISELKGTLEKPVDLIFNLTCLEKDEVLQVKNNKDEESLNFDDFTYGKPIGHGAEKDKYGGEGVYLRQTDGSIMRETKEWHDAWAKTRMELDVSTYKILVDVLNCRYVGKCDVLRKLHEEGNWGKPRFLH